MKKLKVMTIAGTRPELIRLSEIIKKADLYFEHIFVHTGQNYDARLNDIFMMIKIKKAGLLSECSWRQSGRNDGKYYCKIL